MSSPSSQSSDLFALSDAEATRIALQLEEATEQEIAGEVRARKQRELELQEAGCAGAKRLHNLLLPRWTQLTLTGRGAHIEPRTRERIFRIYEPVGRFSLRIARGCTGWETVTMRLHEMPEECSDLWSAVEAWSEGLPDAGVWIDWDELTIARLGMARIVSLPCEPESYFEALGVWKRPPGHNVARIRWNPVGPDFPHDPRAHRLLFPELDALDESVKANRRWWQVEITATGTQLLQATLGAEASHCSLKMVDLDDYLCLCEGDDLFTALLTQWILARGLKEASFASHKLDSSLTRGVCPPWLRFAADETIARRWREMACAAGAPLPEVQSKTVGETRHDAEQPSLPSSSRRAA